MPSSQDFDSVRTSKRRPREPVTDAVVGAVCVEPLALSCVLMPPFSVLHPVEFIELSKGDAPASGPGAVRRVRLISISSCPRGARRGGRGLGLPPHGGGGKSARLTWQRGRVRTRP